MVFLSNDWVVWLSKGGFFDVKIFSARFCNLLKVLLKFNNKTHSMRKRKPPNLLFLLEISADLKSLEG